MNIDKVNKEFYNLNAENFDKLPFEDILIPLLTKYLPKKGSILEIGSGAGALALWLENQGYDVTCIEPAEKPAALALKKGLKVDQVSFQDFTTDKNFDFIVAISSLIHIPRSKIPAQIEKMFQILSPEGISVISLMEGNDENFEDPTSMGKQRFFSKFTLDELKVFFSQYFSFVGIQKIEVKKMNQIFFILVLKSLRK